MKPDERFLRQPKPFWANVRSISEKLGYTARGTNQIRVYSISEMTKGLAELGLQSTHIADDQGSPTELGQLLHDYFAHRASVLNHHVAAKLMTLARAKSVYHELDNRLSPTCHLPKNKQTGAKSGPAYFTGIVNMLIEANIGGMACDYNPGKLTTFTMYGMPLRTFARRVDGAFPSTVSPIAIWEVKEYYHTTSFGSRVAGGVYETLLDGLEVEELREHESIEVKHYLMVDAYETWWAMGRSYLCRMVDMLHMGYVDEVLFGYEVVEEMPRIAQEWVRIANARATP